MVPKRSYRDEPPSASSSTSDTEVDVEEDAATREEDDDGEETQEEQGEEHGEDDEDDVSAPSISPQKPLPQSSESDTESDRDPIATLNPVPDRRKIHRPAMPNGKPAPGKSDDSKKRSGEEAAAGSNGVEPKRVKVESNSEAEKKQFFQRIWSESDEMEVMKGLVEFTSLKKDNPVYDSNDFYQFIKKKLESSVSKQQLNSKVQNLKKRFRSHEKRLSKGAKLKPQEEAFLELAREVWGSAEKTVKKEKAKVVSAVVIDTKEEGSFSGSRWISKVIAGFYPGGVIGEEFIRKGMDLVDDRKKSEFDKRWMRLQAKELEILTERARLIQEQSALIAHAYKSLDS